VIGKHVCLPGRLGILAGLFVPFLAAQTAARHAGNDVRTFDLLSQPESEVLANARKVFRQGDIVRIVDGKPSDLQRLLGIGGAVLRNARVPVYQVVAARATRTGALHEFQQLGTEAMDASGVVKLLSAYEAWAEKERRLAQKEETGALPGDPAPPAQAWTELQQTTFISKDDSGNIFQNTVSIFRLNDISLQFDWYMVLTDPESQPNYQGCTVFGFGTCGWWTHQRVFTMSTNPQAVLFDHGPLNKITTETASFSIGGSITATGPGISAGYSISWQQPSVTTTDQSNLPSGTGNWNEAFQDEGVVTKPPETSIGLFLSHQGSIFQVPEGTLSFQFTLDEPVTSYFQPRFNNPSSAVQDASFSVNISPPIFQTSLSALSIPPGGSGNFELTAVNPTTNNSGFGLAWEVTNLPTWLTVSQTSGSGSARLILNVAPGTALGTVGSLNVNTNPAFAAPSVEVNPLLVRVTVGQPNDTGIMLTGGTDAQSHVLNVADLYSPQLGQFDLEVAMQSPRSSHTATLLLSGELLLTGGAVGVNTGTASAETFDPTKAQFSSTAGMMTDNRQAHTATLLQSGKVLVAGGTDNASSGGSLATAELYDPDTRTFTATGSMTGLHASHSSTALLDGTVLIAGGLLNISLGGSVTNVAEIYDPSTGRFTATGNLTSAIAAHTATRLQDGRVLIGRRSAV
jgi:hypothetical protein